MQIKWWFFFYHSTTIENMDIYHKRNLKQTKENSIGKISITIFDINDTTQINIAVKDGQLRIIKIEHSDKKTYMQTLYNYNSK